MFSIFILFLVIFILAYIKIRYPFWNLQPVYHSYDFWNLFISKPYIVYKFRPVKNKFCDFINVKTKSYFDLTIKEQELFVNLIQCYHISSDKLLYIMNKENIATYFIGQSETPYISFYNEITINKDNNPIGCISSRSVNIILPEKTYISYFFDYMSINREHTDVKIVRRLIQTHEYNQRILNPKIQVSIFKKEIELYDYIRGFVSIS